MVVVVVVVVLVVVVVVGWCRMVVLKSLGEGEKWKRYGIVVECGMDFIVGCGLWELWCMWV